MINKSDILNSALEFYKQVGFILNCSFILDLDAMSVRGQEGMASYSWPPPKKGRVTNNIL